MKLTTYEIVITHNDGREEKFDIGAEGIIDIHSALSFTLKNKNKLGRVFECMPVTYETVSKIDLGPGCFDY